MRLIIVVLAIFAILMLSALIIHVLLYGTETGQVIDEIIAKKLKGRDDEID